MPRLSKTFREFLKNPEVLFYEEDDIKVEKIECDKFTWFISNQEEFPKCFYDVALTSTKYNVLYKKSELKDIPAYLKLNKIESLKRHYFSTLIYLIEDENGNTSKQIISDYRKSLNIFGKFIKYLPEKYPHNENYYFHDFLKFSKPRGSDEQINYLLSDINISDPNTTADDLHLALEKIYKYFQEDTINYKHLLLNPNINFKKTIEKGRYIFPTLFENIAFDLYLVENPNPYLLELYNIYQTKKQLNQDLF